MKRLDSIRIRKALRKRWPHIEGWRVKVEKHGVYTEWYAPDEGQETPNKTDIDAIINALLKQLQEREKQ